MSINRMDLFNQTKSPRQSKSRLVNMMNQSKEYNQPNTVNPDQFPAYKDNSLKRDFARTVLSNLVKNQYYKSAEVSAQQAREIHLDMIQQDPTYFLKGLIKSRDANIKAQTQIGLAVFMSKVSPMIWKNKVGEAGTVEDVLVELTASLAPRQMLATAEMLRNKVFGKGLGTAAKRVFARAMATWSPKYAEYYAITYRNEINQLLRMVHPPKGYFNKDAYKALYAAIDGVGPITKRQEIAFNMVKDPINYNVSDQKFGELLIKYDIDWMTTVGLKNVQSSRAWLARMMQMSASALLLNLVNLDRHGVFDYPEAIQYLDQKMSEVGRARILPMDIVRAYKMVTNPQVLALLRKGFANSFNYKIEAWDDKKVAFFLDISGSMNGNALSYAGSIAASLLPSINREELTFGLFDHDLHMEDGTYVMNSDRYYSNWSNGYIDCPKVSSLSPDQMFDALFNLQVNGGTDTALTIQYLLNNRIFKDIIILVTDEQQNKGNQMYREFKKYQSMINPDAQLFIINPTDYEWHNADLGDPDVFVFNTVTPAIFRSIPELGKADELVDQINIGEWLSSQKDRRLRFRERETYRPEYL